MRHGTALVWKEWQQQRWLFAAGLILFLAWPLLEALNHYRVGHAFRTDMPEAMVMLLGGPFAILVAVGATSQDLKEQLACFWQSRPIVIWRWVLAKYLMGLAIVLAVLTVPLTMQIWMYSATGRSEYALTRLCSILICHTFSLVLIYSLAFVAGCIIRAPVYAVIFSAAAALLVYFLPVLAPPLGRFSTFNLMAQWPFGIVELRQIGPGGPWFAHKLRTVKIPGAGDWALLYNIELAWYIVVVLLGSFLVVVLAGLAVKRNWQIRVGQKLMFWSLGVVGLLLFLTAAFQLGSNLKCLDQISLGAEFDKGECGVAVIASEGQQGLLLLYDGRGKLPSGWPDYSVCRFDLSRAHQKIGERIGLGRADSPSLLQPGETRKIAWSPKYPDMAYLIRSSGSYNKQENKWDLHNAELLAISVADAQEGQIVTRLDLQPYLQAGRYATSYLYMDDNALYANVAGQLVIFTLDGRGRPEVQNVINEAFGFHSARAGRDPDGRTFITRFMKLIPLPNLSKQKNLKITIALSYLTDAMDSEADTVVAVNRDCLKVFRLKDFDGDIATLEMTGYRVPTPLERLVGSSPEQVFLRDGLAYVLDTKVGFGGLTVYDIRQPGRIRRVGHYAAPAEFLSAIAPLPDGNILVGGRRLHIVAPPRAAATGVASVH